MKSSTFRTGRIDNLTNLHVCSKFKFSEVLYEIRCEQFNADIKYVFWKLSRSLTKIIKLIGKINANNINLACKSIKSGICALYWCMFRPKIEAFNLNKILSNNPNLHDKWYIKSLCIKLIYSEMTYIYCNSFPTQHFTLSLSI